MRILVVEDEPSIANFVRQGLTEAGHSDTGPGIAAEHLLHLFERFYRVESDRARHTQGNGQGGAGLGLAVAYEIARAHGGTIQVESPVKNRTGSVFTIQLPLPLSQAHS